MNNDTEMKNDQNIPDFDPPIYSQVNPDIPPWRSHLPPESFTQRLDNHFDPVLIVPPETTNSVCRKYENIVIFFIIMSSILGSFGLFYYSYTFEEPDIFFIECSVKIDEDNKNYNKSNPLNTCHETVTQTGSEGILEKDYPIKEVKNISRVTMIGSLIFFCLIGFCIDKKKNSYKSIIYSVVFLVFLATLISYIYSVPNTDSDYVCPLIETSKIFVSSDSELADKYSDFIMIDPDGCKDMFNYIPRWIFFLPVVSMVLMLVQCYFG